MPMKTQPIYTRSDLDGLLSCAILKEAGFSGEIEFLNPLDLLGGSGAGREPGLRVNLPGPVGLRWDRNCWADEPWEPKPATAAAAVLEMLADPELNRRFLPWLPELEKWQTRRLTEADILSPTPTLQLAALCDPATGLGRCRDFIVSNYFFLLDLVDQLRSQPAEVLIRLGDVQDRLALLAERRQAHGEQTRRTLRSFGCLLVQDLREELRIEPGNPMVRHLSAPPHRALLTLYWDKGRRRVSMTLSGAPYEEPAIPLGALLQPYGGGGDAYAGLAQLAPDQADAAVEALKAALCGQTESNDTERS